MTRALAFTMYAGENVLQQNALMEPGQMRLRLLLTQKIDKVWNPDHEIFVGVLFGKNYFFGYLCGASPFLGVYSLRCCSSGACKAEKPTFITGSGTRLEFDFDLKISMEQMNGVVNCVR